MTQPEVTQPEKCEAILRAVVQLMNRNGEVKFLEDRGHFTAQVSTGKRTVTVGTSGLDTSFESLIDDLYRAVQIVT